MVKRLEWLSVLRIRASRLNRSSPWASSEKRVGKIFIATSRLSRVSLARNTSPIPPAPSGEMISYGPNWVPGARGIMDRDYNPEKRCPVPSDFKCLINAQTGQVDLTCPIIRLTRQVEFD